MLTLCQLHESFSKNHSALPCAGACRAAALHSLSALHACGVQTWICKRLSLASLSKSCLSCSAVQYLQAVAKNVSSLQNVNNGLKPTEVSLPSGCIEEIDANYEGDTVSDILTDPAGLTADDCCLKCK